MIKTGGATLTIGGSSDNPGNTVIVNGGIVTLAKTSSASVHAINAVGEGLRISTGTTVQLAGTGDDQISSTAGVTDNGTFDLGGHNEGIDTLTGNGTIKNSSFTQTSTLTVGENNGSSTFGGVFFGTGSIALTKAGTGAFTVTRPILLTGPVTVDGGTLVMSGDGPRPLTINSGTFVGNGSFGPATIMGDGALVLKSFSNPGSNALFTASSLNLGAGNTSIACGFGVTPGMSGDLLHINGSLALGGTTSIAISGGPGGIAPGNHTFATYGTLTGSEANLAVANPGNYRQTFSFVPTVQTPEP